MARLSEEKINEIRSRADIADVISRYVPLTRKARGFVCTCPFHDDHNPSMSISTDKQIYKCFVCNAGGNVFTFVQNFEHISFVEAVLKVADYAGVEVEEADRMLVNETLDPNIASIHKVCRSVIEYTNYTLATPQAAEVKAYLLQRGINEECIRKFEIGYNPKGDALYAYMNAKKFTDAQLVESNVVRISPSGMHDVFANRILIPIHDRNGNPVGFTARRVDENDEAKYINTSETPAFKKGSLIFNYHRAKVEAKSTGRILIVEGAMDVIAFEKVGIHDCVATLGTACTREQLMLLKNLHAKCVICYDGDRAGINATYKFGKLAREIGLHFEVVDNQLGLDPDEIIDGYGKDELIHMAEKTISWIDFLFRYLQQKYNLENYSQRKEFAVELGREINTCTERFERKNYLAKLFELTQFDMSEAEVKEKKNVLVTPSIGLRQPKNGSLRAEYEILSQMLVSLQANNAFKDKLGFLIDENCNKLAIYIIDYYRTHDEIEIADFYNSIKEEAVKSLLIELSEWELALPDYNEDVFLHSCLKIQAACLEDKMKKLSEQSLKISDPLEKAKIGDEIIQLKRQRSELLKQR